MRPLEHGGARRRRKDSSRWRARGQIKVYFLTVFRASLVAQMAKHLPAMRETRVQSLDWEDPLEGNGNPLQYSCLENPMDRGPW